MTPLCKDCIHMKRDETMRERCYHPSFRFKGQPCNIERLEGFRCTPDAKLFEKREFV